MPVLVDGKGKFQVIDYIEHYHEDYERGDGDKLFKLSDEELLKIYREAKRHSNKKYG